MESNWIENSEVRLFGDGDGRVCTPPVAEVMKKGKSKAESSIRDTGAVTQTGVGAMWRGGHSVPLLPLESTDWLAEGL